MFGVCWLRYVVCCISIWSGYFELRVWHAVFGFAGVRVFVLIVICLCRCLGFVGLWMWV